MRAACGEWRRWVAGLLHLAGRFCRLCYITPPASCCCVCDAVAAGRHVAEPYTRRYSQWQLQHLLGKSGTEGTYNQRLYRYGISRAAENPRDLEEAYRPRVQ